MFHVEHLFLLFFDLDFKIGVEFLLEIRKDRNVGVFLQKSLGIAVCALDYALIG